MTALFDASPYSESEPKTVRSLAENPSSIMSDGTWVALARLNARVADYAHRLKWIGPIDIPLGQTLGDGAVITACGLTGRALAIPPGATINPCQKCRKKAS